MSERPTEALRKAHDYRVDAAFLPPSEENKKHMQAKTISWLNECDDLDATIAAKDRRIAELNRCVGLIRNADAYGMEPKSADAARYWDDALRLANDLYEEPGCNGTGRVPAPEDDNAVSGEGGG